MNPKQEVSKFELMFREDPVWRVLIRLALPSMIMMLVMGSYFFFDNVLSINLAGHVYNGAKYQIPGLNGSTLVRIFMNGFSPINSLMIALALFFGVGIAIRSTINLGKGDRPRAEKTIRTGFICGMSLALIATPILIVSAKAWIESQYKSMDARSVKIIGDNAFSFAWPVILSFPMIMFNNIIPSLLRNEARMKSMTFAIIFPILFNLFFDWVLMGPVGMGVSGGAWATFTSNCLTTLFLIFFIFCSQTGSLLKWKILIGKDIKWLALIGIMFVGVAPFLRNIAQSITSTVQTNIINQVSGNIFSDDYLKFWSSLSLPELQQVLGDPHSGYLALLKHQSPEQWKQLLNQLNLSTSADTQTVASKIISLIPKDPATGHLDLAHWEKPLTGPGLAAYLFMHNVIGTQASSAMISIMSGAMPVFILFFPMMFSFVQAASPVASFNYGAKLFNRVRQVYWWTIIYAAVSAIIVYFLVAWGISGVLIKLLNIQDVTVAGHTIIKSAVLSSQVLKIIMIALVAYVFGIAAMVIFSSTDRILFSMIASSLQGLILIWAVIYPFKELAIAHPHNHLLFFWYLPVLTGLASIVATIMVVRTLFLINKKHQVTLDERIDHFYELQAFHIAKRSALKKAKKTGNYAIVKAEWVARQAKNKQARKATHAQAQALVTKNYLKYKAQKIALKNKK